MKKYYNNPSRHGIAENTKSPILHNIRTLIVPLILLGAFAPVLTLQSAMLPFVEDFSGTTTDLTLTNQQNSSWSQSSGALRLTATDGAGASASSASTSFSELGGSSNNGFTLQTDFTVSGSVNSGGFIFAGFMVLGDQNDHSFYGYRVETRFETGLMRIQKIGGSGDITHTQQTFGSFTFGETYTATVQGVYGNNGPAGADSLDLTFTIEGGDLVTPRQVTASDNSGSLMTGSHFGLRNRVENTTGMEVAFDQLTVIPEPSSVVLVLTGLVCGMVMLRRRS
ncbi:MAG: PEP-CTERM sorting domain-containing protein [Verrucomicrobia bacterium]|nr:PEP-CTERM sorting domain-containing protein [Verrucomicrobiota bacterium]MCH8527442.1 PEP-CTERM sorting domain-containing protein [Kiritimatiellia bacterium]